MADNTPSYDLSGILVPRKFSTTLAADYASGTDYTEADRKPGAVTFGGSTAARMVLEASGDVDATTTSAPVVKVTRGGMPGQDGAGFVYRYGTSGDWYGADPTYALTGFEQVESAGANRTYGQCRTVVLPDGTIVAVAVRTNIVAAYWTVECHTRTVAGVWSSNTIATSLNTTGSTEVALCLAPDGALQVYWPQVDDNTANTLRISMFRSEDGVTWRSQGDSVNGIGSLSSITHLAAGTIGGSVVLFTGGTSSQQYVSADGGYSFEAVGSAESNRYIADIVTAQGYLHAVEQQTNGSEPVYVRRIASGGQSFWAATATSLGNSDKDHGAFIVDTPSGLLVYFIDSGGDMYEQPYRSTDAGSSWSAYDGHMNNTPAVIVGHPGAVWHRGRLHVIGYATTVSTGAAIANRALVDMILAGHSVVPMYKSGVGDVERIKSTRRSWVPVELLDASGWTASDSGTVTRTLTNGYERVTVAAASTAENSYAGTVSADLFDRHYGHCIVALEVTAGRAEVVVEARGVSVSVFVTSAYIDVVETGTSPVMEPHNISGALELRIICDAQESKGRCWYRAHTDSDERAWTALPTATLSTTTYTQQALKLKAEASTTVDYIFVHWRYALLPPYFSVVDMDTTVGTDIAPCPILASRRTFLGSGMFLRGRGGPARYDASTYDVSLGGGLYRKANLLPAVSPSPRAPWRSSATTTQTLKFTVEPETATETEWMSGLVGYYLDGLVNVPTLTLKNSGATIGAVDLRTAFKYEHDTGVIYPTASGAAVAGVYVAEGSLIGCQFEFADGKIRTIVDNTEGVLTSGSTVAEKRCRIRVDGLTGSEDTVGTGYIWPQRALILQYLRGTREVTQVQIEIASSVSADSRGYREIGVVAIGEVSVLGRAFDRTASDEIAAGVEVFEGTDGASVASRRGPTRRTVELAFVESPTFLGEVRSGGSPDYVTVSASGSALPAATELGIPMTAEGIYRRTDGAILPVVPIRRIPRDTGSGSALYVSTIGGGAIAEGAMLARMDGSIRREQIQVGQAYVDDAERVATITFREVV